MKQPPLGEVGDRVRVVYFSTDAAINDNITVPPGTEGTINMVDAAGTRHTIWDNGRTIGLLPRCDEWEVLS